MPDIRKLLKKTSNEDENNSKKEDPVEETADIENKVKELKKVENTVVPDFSDDDDIVIGDDDDTEDNNEDNDDDEIPVRDDTVKSEKKKTSIQSSVKKSLPKNKKKISTKKKPSTVKIADITKSSAMDELLINFLENKWVDWLKTVLRKHIIDQFDESIGAITKENEKISSLFEKNLKNNTEVVKSVHGIYDRYAKLQNTDFNNGILPANEVDQIKSDNLLKIERSISIVLNQYKNMLESELARLTELDIFWEFDPLNNWIDNNSDLTATQVKIVNTTKPIETEVINKPINVTADSEREKELISEMEKYLGENSVVDDSFTAKEDTPDDKIITEVEEAPAQDINIRELAEENEQEVDADWIDSLLEVIEENTVSIPEIKTEENTIDIETSPDPVTDIAELLSSIDNISTTDVEVKPEDKNEESSEIDLGFLDSLDEPVTENKFAENIVEETKPVESNGEFDADEFLRDLDKYSAKEKNNVVVKNHENDDDDEPIKISV